MPRPTPSTSIQEPLFQQQKNNSRKKENKFWRRNIGRECKKTVACINWKIINCVGCLSWIYLLRKKEIGGECWNQWFVSTGKASATLDASLENISRRYKSLQRKSNSLKPVVCINRKSLGYVGCFSRKQTSKSPLSRPLPSTSQLFSFFHVLDNLATCTDLLLGDT